MFLKRRLSIGAMALALVVGVGQLAQASAIVVDAAYQANSLGANDDGSTGFVSFGFGVNFYGVPLLGAYLNNNGNLTFGFSDGTYTPSDLTTPGNPARLAPYFADVDTRGSSALMTYGAGTFDGHNSFGVDWVNVGYYQVSPGPNRNSFQLLIVDRSDIGAGDFDFMFNYDQIQWEAGQASGSTSQGCGGVSAHVGWTNGTAAPGTFFELPGSGVNGAFLDSGTCVSSPGPDALILHSLNSNVEGRYIFSVREGQVVQPPSAVPEPTSLILLGTGIVGVMRRRMRARKQ